MKFNFTVILNSQISILGCGWLGLDLAKILIAKNYAIKGSTTSTNKIEKLKFCKIEPYIIRLKEDEIEGDYSGFLARSEVLVINIPPGLRRNSNKNHVEEIKQLIPHVEKSSIQKVIFVSSISVFKNEKHFPKIKATTLPNSESNNGKQLIEIENLLSKNSNFETTILRLGGLFDEVRHPGRYLSGKQNVKNPEAPINLIHKADVIAIITALLEQNISSIKLNAVFPKHTKKYCYYEAFSKAHNLEVPSFDFSEESKGKFVDTIELVQLLNYTFKMTP